MVMDDVCAGSPEVLELVKEQLLLVQGKLRQGRAEAELQDRQQRQQQQLGRADMAVMAKQQGRAEAEPLLRRQGEEQQQQQQGQGQQQQQQGGLQSSRGGRAGVELDLGSSEGPSPSGAGGGLRAHSNNPPVSFPLLSQGPIGHIYRPHIRAHRTL